MWNKTVYTIQELAHQWRVDEADIVHEITAGRLAALQIAGKTRIPVAAWRRFAGLRTTTPASRRMSRWSLLAGMALLAAGGVIAMDLPFPMWQGQEIPPQTALFKDDEVFSDGDPQRYAPVNAPLDYRRYNEAANPPGRGFTHSLLSLQQQNNVEPGSLSFPWTAFIRLDTNHDRGDGVGSIVNLYNRGSGWATGYHVDSFALGTGTTLGSNIELLDLAGQGAYTVGMNIQNKAFKADVGMQIQVGALPDTHPLWQPGMDGSWQTGIMLSSPHAQGRFETGLELGPRTSGRRGIWLRGDYATGIDLGENDLSMQAGALLTLANAEQVALRFNAQRERIEFVQAGQVLAFLPVDSRNVNLAN